MSTPATKPSRQLVWAAVACAASALVLFQFVGSAAKGYVQTDSLLWWWVSQWLDPQSETEHGWMILGLSVWLGWRNLRLDDRRRPTGDFPGSQTAIAIWPPALAMIAGLALHALGFVAQQGRISIVALLVFAWGVLRLGGGRRWGSAALFPLGFMVFAIPINVFDSLGFWLRVWVVDASVPIARAAGIDVLRSGTQLLAPDGAYNYDVAAACSGIRSLTAMAALSLLAGYLNFRTGWRRALLLALSFPLVYVGNVARIVAIILAAAAGGPVWGDRAHEVMGYGVFGIVLGGVLGAAGALRRWCPESRGQADPDTCHVLSDTVLTPCREEKMECHVLSDKTSVLTGGVTVAVILLAGGEAVFLHHVANSPVRGEVGVALAADGSNPVELPAFLGTEWIGRSTEVTAVERTILPPDTGFSRKLYIAVADARQQVLLSIVLSGRDRTSIHRPELCLVGQGWTIAGTAPHTFHYPGNAGAAVPATLLRVRREVRRSQEVVVVPQLVAYWFVSGDGVVATHLGRFLRDASNRVIHGRADRWAYVLMQTEAVDGEAAALGRMQAVLDGTLEVFAPKVFAPQKPKT